MRLVIAAILAAQVAAPPQTTFRSGVEVVELDVSVMRGGAPVAGLTARDFALTDNGVPQDLQTVPLEKLLYAARCPPARLARAESEAEERRRRRHRPPRLFRRRQVAQVVSAWAAWPS